MILALTLSAKTCNTLSADYSARLDALSLSLTRTSARACGTLTGDAAAFPKLINTLNRDINGAICRRAVRVVERLTLAADEIGQGLPLDDEPTPSVCEVVAEAPAEVIEAPAEVIEAPAAEALARAERVRAALNVAAAADALAQLSPVEARALFAAPFGVNLYSVPSAALDLTSRPLPNAAVLAVELSAEVVIRISAPTGAGAELSAPLTLELFERLADGSCVRLIRDLERVEGAERLAPVWSLPIAPRTFARYNLARYALSYSEGVALFAAERGLMVEVLEALGAAGLAAKAAKAPAAELPAPAPVVVEAPAPVSVEVVEANGAAAADAWVDVERAKRHYTQALRASVEGSSIVSAAARRFLDAARALDQLNDGVEAPAYPADEYIAEARLAVRQAPMTARRLALALALDVQALFSSTVTPSAELLEAARAWCAAEVAAGVPVAGFLARVVERLVDLSLSSDEAPAPVVVNAPAPVVVNAPPAAPELAAIMAPVFGGRKR
jgi:hypothetical protein